MTPRHCLIPASFVLLAVQVCTSPKAGANQSQSQAQPPSASSPAAAPSASAEGSKTQQTDKDAATKKKPKKVWTEDDLSKVGGGISVVGDSSGAGSGRTSTKSNGTNSGNSSQNAEVEHYRDELRQLQAQLDTTDKKINDLRNFKADNSAPSGGINPNHGYTMTPVADQIKQLEEKKKQIQDKIDNLTDEARKKGIEPGQLR